MDVLGKLRELVSIIFQSDNQNIIIKPNDSTTYTQENAVSLPNEDAATSELASLTATQTLTNKTLTSPSITTPTGIVKGDVGLGNVDNTSDATKDAAATTLTNKTIVVANNTITTAASGNLVATELDTALAELQTDIDTRALDGDLTTHESDTSTHGVATVAGLIEAQTFTNKTIDADNNTITNLAHGSEVDNPTSGVHGVTGSVVGTTDTQTLTNKLHADLVYDIADDASAGPIIAVSDKPIIRFTNASLTSLTDMTGGEDGEVKTLLNKTGGIINVTTTGGGDGFLIGGETSLDLEDNGSATFVAYNSGGGIQWHLVGGAGGGAGGLVPVAITHTSLPLTGETGKFYLVDMSGATTDETLTLPNIVTAEESIGVQIVAAHATYRLIVASDASDTVEGSTQFALQNKSDWRVLNAQSSSNWFTYRASSGSGAIITPWQFYKPGTQGLGSPDAAQNKMQWRQVGGSIEIQGHMELGSPSPVEARINLPNGYTIDFETASTGTVLVGELNIDNASGGAYSRIFSIMATNGDTYFNISRNLTDESSNPMEVRTGSGLGIPNGQRVSFYASVPVLELTNTGTTITLNDLTAKTKKITPTFSSTPTGWSDQGSSIQGFRDSDGNYSCWLSFYADITSASSASVTIDGIVPSFDQALAAYRSAPSTGSVSATVTTAGVVTATFDIADSTTFRCNSTICLGTNKPDWFDANVENSQSIDAQIAPATSNASGTITSFVPVIKDSFLIMTNSDYTVLDDDGYDKILINISTSTDRTITLPTAADNEGRVLHIIKGATGTGGIIIDGEGAEQINATSSERLEGSRGFITIVCDGSSWVVLGLEDNMTVAPGGGFNAGEFKITRSMNKFTLSTTVALTSSSAGTSKNSAVIIPSAWRPAGPIGSMYHLSTSDSIYKISVNSSGTITTASWLESFALNSNSSWHYPTIAWNI